MSIGARIVVTISFQKVNAAPHTEACTQGNHQGLKGRNCGLKKCHIVFAGTGYRSKPEERRRVSLRQLLFKNCAALPGVCVRCQGVGCLRNLYEKCSHDIVAALSNDQLIGFRMSQSNLHREMFYKGARNSCSSGLSRRKAASGSFKMERSSLCRNSVPIQDSVSFACICP